MLLSQQKLPGSQRGLGGEHLHAHGSAGDQRGRGHQPPQAESRGNPAAHIHVRHPQELPVGLPDVRHGLVVDVVSEQEGDPEVWETVSLEPGFQLLASDIMRKAVSSGTSEVVNIVIEQTRGVQRGDDDPQSHCQRVHLQVVGGVVGLPAQSCGGQGGCRPA